MTECQKQRHTVQSLKKNLERLEKLIRSPYARPADVQARDRVARRLLEAMALRKAS